MSETVQAKAIKITVKHMRTYTLSPICFFQDAVNELSNEIADNPSPSDVKRLCKQIINLENTPDISNLLECKEKGDTLIFKPISYDDVINKYGK